MGVNSGLKNPVKTAKYNDLLYGLDPVIFADSALI